MQLSKINLINSILVALFLSAVLATNVSAETTFYDNPDEFVIYPPLSESVQQTGGHGGSTTRTTIPPAAINCTQDWVCGEWSSCSAASGGSAIQTRACADSNDCDYRHKKGNVSKVIAVQKPAESRDCKETALPKVETPTHLAVAPTPQQKTASTTCGGGGATKLSISPVISAIALLAIITIIVVKFYVRRKGDYIIVYLHRDKHHNNKCWSDKAHSNNLQSNKHHSKKQ